MTGCTVTNNNTKGFDRGWEAGGNKIVLTRGMVIENSVFADNKGDGIWFDIGNGFAFSPGDWGANAGISISSSPNCLIERNLLIGNKEGLSLREQKRSTPLIEGGSAQVWNHHVTVRNNVLAYNRDAQVWGWFDVDDERHWPKSGQKPNGMAKDISLDDLALKFDKNLYGPSPGQGFFHWGVTWKRHEHYPDLDAVRRQLGFEQWGRSGDVFFLDIPKLDLRVPANNRAVKMRCYPKGSVPGVTLGTYTR